MGCGLFLYPLHSNLITMILFKSDKLTKGIYYVDFFSRENFNKLPNEIKLVCKAENYTTDEWYQPCGDSVPVVFRQYTDCWEDGCYTPVWVILGGENHPDYCDPKPFTGTTLLHDEFFHDEQFYKYNRLT